MVHMPSPMVRMSLGALVMRCFLVGAVQGWEPGIHLPFRSTSQTVSLLAWKSALRHHGKPRRRSVKSGTKWAFLRPAFSLMIPAIGGDSGVVAYVLKQFFNVFQAPCDDLDLVAIA